MSVLSKPMDGDFLRLLDTVCNLLPTLSHTVSISLSLCFVAETPIEEFTPTPAFPALQYLESVDVEGVAWRAGLRTGDFLIEVSPDAAGRVTDGSQQHLRLQHKGQHRAQNYFPL